MTLEQLKIFIEAVRYGSFTLAAGKLGLTQSAVSISIRKLEERHDVILFTRAGNGLLVTEAGKMLLAEAERIVLDVERTIKRVESYRDVSCRKTIIACSHNAYDHWMPGIMSMIARTPAMPPVELMVGRADEVAAWVMRGTADVGLNESLPGHTQFRYWEVFSDTLILCAAASHANTSPMLLDWVGIEEIGTIVWETETDLERFVIDAFHTHQLYVKRLREDSFRLTSSAAVLSVIESGAWAGFVTESLARSRLAAGQLIKLGDFDIPVKYWLFSPRHQENQSLAAAIAKAAGQLRGLYSRADQTEPEASLPAVPLSMD